MPLVVTVDEPGFTEYAHPDYAPWLTVTDGMRDARVIARYIEKGSRENRERLCQAIEDDPEVRAEVIGFAPLMLDHPWAAERYRPFLDHARMTDSATRLGQVI